mmetsp:Transcript_5147/g.7742  ORF Transcript_5147/g.7742 Transcript_5147/m.7742 type:complete len:218 (-) Transcript_5147:40-693(-)
MERFQKSFSRKKDSVTSLQKNSSTIKLKRIASDFRNKEHKEPKERFNPYEIKQLRTEYRKFSNKMEIMTRKGFMEYFALEELDNSFIFERLYSAFSNSGSIDFEKFLNGVGVLVKGTFEERVEFYFKMFDIKKSGVTDRNDLKRVYLSLLNSMLEVEVDSDEVQLLQEEVLNMTEQEREDALDSVLDSAFVNRSVMIPEEFLNFIATNSALRKVFSL